MSGRSIDFSSEESTAPWQYRLTLWFIRQVLDVADAMAFWCDKLEEWAAKRWGGYSTKDLTGHSGQPWCQEATGYMFSNKPGEVVQPGDIVRFDWSGDELHIVRRLKSCVERWPECSSGNYDPRCCRFPKSCSATIFDSTGYKDEDLV